MSLYKVQVPSLDITNMLLVSIAESCHRLQKEVLKYSKEISYRQRYLKCIFYAVTEIFDNGTVSAHRFVYFYRCEAQLNMLSLLAGQTSQATTN